MAIKAQGSAIAMESARAAAKTITGITAASPPVVTSTAHGYANGDIIYIDSVVGMTQVNGRAFVAANIAANTFELKGVNGLAYTAYASAGSAYKCTMISIAEAQKLSFAGATAAEIDVTNLLSTGKEYQLGLQDFGTLTMTIFLKNADIGQIALRAARESALPKVFTLTDSALAVFVFVGFVNTQSFDFSVDTSVGGSLGVRITGFPAWFA